MRNKCLNYCAKIIEKLRFIDGTLMYTQLSDSVFESCITSKTGLIQYILDYPLTQQKEQTSSELIQF